VSETVLLWIFGTIITVQSLALCAIAGKLWEHVIHCRDVGATVAEMRGDIKRLLQDIGTHESGLRGQVHDLNRDLLRLDVRVSRLQDGEDER
jgi:hypothetical protein